ncbi:hypothetical protein ACT7DH_15805 [Bacillus pacificus]
MDYNYFLKELYRHLTPSLLEELAKELGFVKENESFLEMNASHMYLE